MKTQEWIFIIALIINAIIAIVYFIIGYMFHKSEKGIGQITIKTAIMLFCPIVSTLFFFIGYLVYRIFMRNEVDLADVVFSKDRVRMLVKADEDRETNMVPMEEAITVADTPSLRKLMLNVLKGDVEASLASISLALNCEDSETSHYAASVLSDALNEYRIHVQKMYSQIKEDYEKLRELRDKVRDESEGNNRRVLEEEIINIEIEICEYAALMIEYMNSVLEKNVFTGIEQKSYVEMMDEVTHIFHNTDSQKMRPEHYSDIILRLVEIGRYDNAKVWSSIMLEAYPMELSSYETAMRIAYESGQKEKFFELMEDLKKSGIVIDNNTMELIRVFQN